MAAWSDTTKHLPSTINNGNQYTTDDDVSLQELNALAENAFYAARVADNAQAATNNGVSYNAQTPTSTEQAQARTNIGAASASDLTTAQGNITALQGDRAKVDASNLSSTNIKSWNSTLGVEAQEVVFDSYDNTKNIFSGTAYTTEVPPGTYTIDLSKYSKILVVGAQIGTIFCDLDIVRKKGSVYEFKNCGASAQVTNLGLWTFWGKISIYSLDQANNFVFTSGGSSTNGNIYNTSHYGFDKIIGFIKNS